MSARELLLSLAAGMFNARSNGAVACFHCGLPALRDTKFGVSFNGDFRAMCCVGCEAVAKTIINAGLGDYYRGRSAMPDVDTIPNNGGIHRRLTEFDLPAIQANYVSTADAGEAKSAAFYIDGVTCNACLWLAESVLKRVPGVTSATVNYVTHRAEVKWRDTETTLASIIDAVTRVGLRAMPVAAAERQVSRARERRTLFIQLGVALLAMMQVMMFTVPLYLTAADDISYEAHRLMQWASLMLTLPVVLYSAKPFWQGALSDLCTRHLSMDAPVALAIASTFASSLWSIFNEQGALYFDSISMFVFLLLASRYLESSIRDRALSRIERLTNAVPAVANQLIGYPNANESSKIISAALEAGDVILVGTGQIIAADSILLEGAGEVDEAIATGESRPVTLGIGSTLIGGTLNLGAPLIARVARVGTASTLASIARLAERSLGERPQLAALTDRVATIVAPSLIVLACIAAVVWFFIDSAQSFNVAVAVLAVTCPCAIALAVPLAFTSATLTISKHGLLIARGHVLEVLPTITDVVFDKTGTLTTGQLVITDIVTAYGTTRDEIVAVAQMLEIGAAHPIARAIQTLTIDYPNNPTMIAQQLRLIPGGGVEGVIGEKTYRLGNRAFACFETSDDDAFVLSRDGKWLATFETEDALKADAAKTIFDLKQAGLTVHLLSGDRALRVKNVARDLGIDDKHTIAAQTPLQKLAYVERLRKAGCKVAMIGDGVNDAPVLGAADVSIAMGAGADLPRLTADAVMLSPTLSTIVTTLQLARRTKRIVRQNFGWAILYNLIAIPLALVNVINPAWAAIGMGASGLIVVLNSMRLLRSAR
jgi:P-type Cu2+ transporter